MENAVNALKIAFAVFIFMLGLVMLFSMASQARETADTLIEKIDKTSYYSYQEATGSEIDNNGNRIVRIEDIIPVLYRYAQENYGVTIVDKNGNIVARFDLDTETACNNWIDFTKYSKYKFITETNSIYDKVEKIAGNTNLIKQISISVNPSNPTEDTVILNISEGMTNLFKNIYKQNKGNRNYYCRWLGSMSWTSQRIDSDLFRKNY